MDRKSDENFTERDEMILIGDLYQFEDQPGEHNASYQLMLRSRLPLLKLVVGAARSVDE
jgi:hypothetical protein